MYLTLTSLKFRGEIHLETKILKKPNFISIKHIPHEGTERRVWNFVLRLCVKQLKSPGFNQRNELCILQTLMKKVNVSEGGLISYDEFFKSFQKSDAEVSGLRAKYSYILQMLGKDFRIWKESHWRGKMDTAESVLS